MRAIRVMTTRILWKTVDNHVRVKPCIAVEISQAAVDVTVNRMAAGFQNGDFGRGPDAEAPYRSSTGVTMLISCMQCRGASGSWSVDKVMRTSVPQT